MAQQLLKLAAAAILESTYYVTLDSDVCCLKQFSLKSLAPDALPLLNVETPLDYKRIYQEQFANTESELKLRRYHTSAALLAYQRPPELEHVFYGETPCILHTESVEQLTRYLTERLGGPWPLCLAEQRGWTEYSLYFQFLEMRGTLDKLYRKASCNAVLDLERSVWHASRRYKDFRRYDEEHFRSCLDLPQRGPFIAIQSWLPANSWLPPRCTSLGDFYDRLSMSLGLSPLRQTAVSYTKEYASSRSKDGHGGADIVVLSTGRWANFGDRLGFHMLPHIVPPGAVVKYLSWPLSDSDVSSADGARILILWLGTSVFDMLLSPQLVTFVCRFQVRIGIFGTQYRSKIDRGLFSDLVSSLTVWYARYQQDLDLFGSPPNAVHFGDWLIDLFPLACPGSNGTLRILPNIRHMELPLDRTIQRIQRYSHVHSARLHPLLCALTSARSFSYIEEREFAGEEPSGKFRSLFLDVFQQDYPENEVVQCDRDAVVEYKKFARRNIEALARKIAEFLRATT